MTDKPREEVDHGRRRFLGTAAATFAAAELGLFGSADAQTKAVNVSATKSDFGPVKQIDAGVMNVGYVESGPAGGTPVVLLHGWPYDIHTYADVATLLAAKGYRVIVP